MAQDVIILEAPVGGSKDVANAEGEAFWADHESNSVMSHPVTRRTHAPLPCGRRRGSQTPSRRDAARAGLCPRFAWRSSTIIVMAVEANVLRKARKYKSSAGGKLFLFYYPNLLFPSQFPFGGQPAPRPRVRHGPQPTPAPL